MPQAIDLNNSKGHWAVSQHCGRLRRWALQVLRIETAITGTPASISGLVTVVFWIVW